MTLGTLATQLKLNTDEEMLEKYNFIFIDEAHEITLDLAEILLLLKEFAIRNAHKIELPFIILMSATFNEEIYLRYFNIFSVENQKNYQPNLIRVKGTAVVRTEHWLEHDAENYIKEATNVVNYIMTEKTDDDLDHGDIMILLPGASDAKQVKLELDKRNTKYARGQSIGHPDH